MKTITISEWNGVRYITIRGIRGQQSYYRKALNMKTGEWEDGEPVTGKHNPHTHYIHSAAYTEPIVTIGGVGGMGSVGGINGDNFLKIAKLAIEMGVEGYTTRCSLLKGKDRGLLPPVNSVL